MGRPIVLITIDRSLGLIIMVMMVKPIILGRPMDLLKMTIITDR
jgi:hypothetical protein